jgi:uncharacterized membrane protein YdjX (TVP38/TMEM64 family)
MSGWLVAAGGALAALLVAFLQGRLSGAEAERKANRAREADAYEKHLQEIADAASARNAVRPDGVPDDKYRRD